MQMTTKSTAVALFVVGGIFILGGAFVLLAPQYSDSVLRSQLALPPHRFKLESEVQLPTAGPLIFRIAKLNVTYPSTMRENDTLLVEVVYTVTYHEREFPDLLGIVSTDPFPPQELRELDRPVSLELSSSGFAVEPKSEVAKPAKARLPITQVWTVTPAAEGSRYLLLKIHEERGSGILAFFPFSYTASINGMQTQADPSGLYKLPVTVSTYWGVSRITSSLIGYALVLIGAVLSYPIFLPWFKRWFRLRDKD